MVKVVVCGASGRMGQTIGRMVNESPDLELGGGINLRPGSFFGVEIVETKNAEALLKSSKAEVLIDFTIASAAVENVKMAARNNVALVVGTTGFSPEPACGDGESDPRACPGGYLKQLLGRREYLLAAGPGIGKAPQGL